MSLWLLSAFHQGNLCVGILRELARPVVVWPGEIISIPLASVHAGVICNVPSPRDSVISMLPLTAIFPTTPHKNARARPRRHLWVEIF